MSHIILPVYKSIIRSITDMISDFNDGGDLPQLQYQDWESRADESKLPQESLLGLDGFSFSENNGLWLISYALGLSSYRDANMLNEMAIIDRIQERMGEKKKIRLLEMDFGSEISELVVSDWQLLPMSQSELRNYRTIGMELKRTDTTMP